MRKFELCYVQDIHWWCALVGVALPFVLLTRSFIDSFQLSSQASKQRCVVCLCVWLCVCFLLVGGGGKQGRRRAQAVQLHNAGMRAGFSFFLCVCVCVFEGVLHFPHSQHSFRQLPSKPISQPRLSLSCLVCCCFVFSFPPLAPFFFVLSTNQHHGHLRFHWPEQGCKSLCTKLNTA